MAPQQPAEEMAMEQPAAEEPAPAEEESPAEEPAAAKEVPAEEESIVEEKAAVESTMVPAPAEAAEDTTNFAGAAESAGEADTDRSSGEEGGGDMQALPTPTLAALVIMTPSPAPTPSPVPQALTAPGEASDTATDEMREESAVAEVPAAPAPVEPDDLAQKEEVLQPLKIQSQVLRLLPGLIYLEGTINVGKGTVLAVALQRNGENFDQWAEPATLQTTTDANGQFSFNIVAADPTTSDLFKQEPATYQIIITSLDPNAPAIAFAYFDTFAPPAATATPAMAAIPSPTVVALLTILPSDTPEAQATPVQIVETAPPAEAPLRTTILIGIIILLVIVVVIAMGLVINWVRK
jgi:hypothetical protein